MYDDADLEETDDRQFVVALARGLRVLRAFSTAPGPLGNREICQQTRLSPSTVSRLTHTLTRLGYLQLAREQRRYILTAKILTLGYPVLAGTTLLERARPILRSLADRTGETAALAVRDGTYMTFLDVAQGHNMLAVRLVAGARLPMAASASGLALLAAMPIEERKTVAARIRASITSRDGDVDQFNRLLAMALEEPVVVVRDAWTEGIGGVAVALTHGDERASMVMPVATDRVDEATMQGELATALKEAAARLR